MKYKNAIPFMGLLILAAMMVIFHKTIYSQNNEAHQVDPVEYFSTRWNSSIAIPEFYPYRDELTQDESRMLAELTAEERKIIEDATEPPAIGIFRSLDDPISFSLNEIKIPEQGEISISGGRLKRVNEDLLVFTTHIKSEKADEIRLYFSEGFFPSGVQVNLFSKNKFAFTQVELRNKLDEYGFYTTTTFADYVILQVVIPVELNEENLYFTIAGVIHVDNSYLPEEVLLTTCFEDANCSYANGYTGIDGLRRSAALLYFPVGGTYYLCSGGLLNDNRSADLQPYVLTANHCLSTQSSAAGLEARFNYWSTSCNSGTVNPDYIIVNGANLLATHSQSDFTLILLKQKGGNYYLGWNVGLVSNNTELHSVHHPNGWLQNYSRHQNKTSPENTCTGYSTLNFHYTRTLGGQTFGGSSGAVISDANGQVRGQLLGLCPGGADDCDYDSYYNLWGKFSVSYLTGGLNYWLFDGSATVSMSTVPASTLDFGSHNIGSGYTMNVTVNNTGSRPNYLNLEAGNVTITGTDASQFSIIGSNFLYLAPGESGSFTIKFTPSSSGLKEATLNIPHNADNINSPIIISLTGYGNPCSGIISLNGGGIANIKTFMKSRYGSWLTNSCSYDCYGNEQVYSFVAPYTGIYNIHVTYTNNTFVDYFWKSGSCSETGWNCITWVYNPTTIGSMNWTAGTTYYILLDAESSSLSTHKFYVFLNPCSNITSIGGTGSSHAKTFTGGANGVWFTSAASPCGYNCPGIEKIYSFVAPYTGYYSIQVTAASGYVDYMWKPASESCSSTGWQCIKDVISTGSYGSMFWTAGVTYYLLLDDENTTPGTHTFYINAPNPCQEIIPITGCGINYSKTFSGSGTGVWNTGANSICNWPCPGTEQIYSFVAPETGQYSIQVTSSAGGYVDYMWKSGNCSSSGWNCIKDIYSPGQYGSMTWTAGNTYYILLDSEVIGSFSHQFHLVCPALCQSCPTYDFLIEPSETWQTHQSSHDISGCKMYRFYAISGLTYTFKTGCGNDANADYDTYLQIFNSDCVQQAYDDDGCEIFRSKIEWTADYYGYAYLKVSGFNNAGGSYRLAYNSCNSSPEQPGHIYGPTTICEGSSIYFDIIPVANATFYTWSLPSSWQGNSNGTSMLATVGSSGGVVSVSAGNACGTSIASNQNVYVIVLAAQPGAIEGPSTVAGGTTHSYCVAPVAGASYYNWFFSGEGTIAGYGTCISLTPTSSGILSVVAVNECGSSLANELSITVTSGIPEFLHLQEITITSGQSTCYAALQTIIVAGSGTSFIVENGGFAELVAGQNIILMEGTKVVEGGSLLGRITLTNNYCAKATSLLATENEADLFIKETHNEQASSFFKIYPNPTSGIFTLELTNFDKPSSISVMIFSMLGDILFQRELPSEKLYLLDFTGKPAGMYLIKVMAGNNFGIEKIVIIE